MSDFKIQTIDDTILGILANRRWVSVQDILGIYSNNDSKNLLRVDIILSRIGILIQENEVESILAENQDSELYYLLYHAMKKPVIDDIVPGEVINILNPEDPPGGPRTVIDHETSLKIEYKSKINVKYEYRIGTSSGNYGEWKDASSYPLVIEKIKDPDKDGDENLDPETSYFIQIRYFRIIDNGPTIYSDPSDEEEKRTLSAPPLE